MKKQKLGNNNLTFKEKIPLDPGVTCVCQPSAHLHFVDLDADRRRSYMDKQYTLSTHCQRLNLPHIMIQQKEFRTLNQVEVRIKGVDFLSEKVRRQEWIAIADLKNAGWEYRPDRRGWVFIC